jgi:ribosomal protein S17
MTVTLVPFHYKLYKKIISSFQYFSEFEYHYAHDPEKICKTGDMVLIQRLPKKLTRLITHEVLDVVYPCGDVTDPITGKKVVVGKYRYVAPFVCVIETT